MGTENVTLSFTDDAVDALSDLAADINDRIENIGARRLHTVLERLLEGKGRLAHGCGHRVPPHTAARRPQVVGEAAS